MTSDRILPPVRACFAVKFLCSSIHRVHVLKRGLKRPVYKFRLKGIKRGLVGEGFSSTVITVNAERAAVYAYVKEDQDITHACTSMQIVDDNVRA